MFIFHDADNLEVYLFLSLRTGEKLWYNFLVKVHLNMVYIPNFTFRKFSFVYSYNSARTPFLLKNSYHFRGYLFLFYLFNPVQSEPLKEKLVFCKKHINDPFGVSFFPIYISLGIFFFGVYCFIFFTSFL